VVERYLELKEA